MIDYIKSYSEHNTMQVGDTLPSVLLQEGNPKTTVNLKELFTGKKGLFPEHLLRAGVL
jgi:hypothetical protein